LFKKGSLNSADGHRQTATPPQYRAVTRLQISPAAGVAQATEAKDAPAVVTDAKSSCVRAPTATSPKTFRASFHGGNIGS